MTGKERLIELLKLLYVQTVYAAAARPQVDGLA